MMRLPRHVRPGSAFALLIESRSPWRFQRLMAGSLLLIVTSCSRDQPMEPGVDKPAAQLSGAVAGALRDDFTDVNGKRLIDHVPDGGDEEFSWIEAPAWQMGGEDQAFIQDNAVATSGSGSWAYVTTVQAPDRAELVVDLYREVSEIQDIVIWLRTAAADLDDGILALWSLGPGSNFVQVDRNGLPGVLVELPPEVSPGLHTFRAEIVGGNRIELAIDSNVVLSEPAGSLPASGRAGIGLWRNGTPDVRLTSFTAGAPQAVRIEAVNGSLNVWPGGLSNSGASGPDTLQLRVKVVAGDSNLTDKWVKLSLAAVDSAAAALDSLYGHHHHKGASGTEKPTGKLSLDSVNTGSNGLNGLVRYTSSVVSSPVMVIGEAGGAKPESVAVRVAVLGLQELLPGLTFDTIIGDTASHWPNNWVTPGMKTLLLKLASDFHAKHSRKLGFNDASLRFGGKLDLRRQWDDNDPACKFRKKDGTVVILRNGCHQRHRVGLDLDLRIRDLKSTQKNDIRLMWPELTKRRVTTVGEEGDHYHLAYRP